MGVVYGSRRKDWLIVFYILFIVGKCFINVVFSFVVFSLFKIIRISWNLNIIFLKNIYIEFIDFILDVIIGCIDIF